MKATRTIKAFVVTHKGLVHDINEDNYFLQGRYMQRSKGTYRESLTSRSTDFLCAVCDGAGGEKEGESASLPVVKGLAETFGSLRTSRSSLSVLLGRLERYLENTNKLLYEKAREAGNRMAATLACLVISDKEAVALNLGDSRVYLMRDGKLHLLTTDHVESKGPVTPSRERRSKEAPGGKILTRYLGMAPEKGKAAAEHSNVLVLRDGDRFLLCSNGLTDFVSGEKIAEIMAANPEGDIACEELVIEALKNGGKDNVTVSILQIEETEELPQTEDGDPVEEIKEGLKAKLTKPYMKILYIILSLYILIGTITLALPNLLDRRGGDSRQTSRQEESSSQDSSEEQPGEDSDGSEQVVDGADSSNEEGEGNDGTGTATENVIDTGDDSNGTETVEGQTDEPIRYEVRKGDTLMSISQKFYGSKDHYKLIVEYNDIDDPDMIQVGQILLIPQKPESDERSDE